MTFKVFTEAVLVISPNRDPRGPLH